MLCLQLIPLHYADCRYAECRGAHCCGKPTITNIEYSTFFNVEARTNSITKLVFLSNKQTQILNMRELVQNIILKVG
jgi:hypothetical protein